MEFSFGNTNLQIQDLQLWPIFWAFLIIVFFNISYFLFRSDRFQQDSHKISKARIWITALIGTLITLSTYGRLLGTKTFEIVDCMILALIAAHGWMAEDMVSKFIQRVNTNNPIDVSEPLDGET